MAKNITNKTIQDYVSENIDIFHDTRIKRLEELKLNVILKRKNPYLFKAKNLTTANDLVKTILDAHLSSQEEGIFGNFIEGVAIFVNENAYGGWKSTAEGIDLEFERDKIRYLVSIKSGPNWGNSSQIKKMEDNFRKAKKIVRGSNSAINVRAVNGCCYGRCVISDKGEYEKYCGQKFWTFISGDENLYQEIIKPLSHNAQQKNDEFTKSYVGIINKFTRSFIESFCSTEGAIQWEKLVQYNSAEKAPLTKN